MAQQIQMLALSPTMEKGVITKWLKKTGDKISEGEVICEVETDKATMEYECPEEGTLLKIVVEEGGEAAVGEVIAMVGEEGEDVSSQDKKPEQEPQAGSEEQPSEEEAKEDSEKPEKKENTGSEEGKQESPEPKKKTEQKKQKPKDENIKNKVKSTPLARKLAKQHGLELSSISGTGPAGRVVVRDVEQAIKKDSKPEKKEADPRALRETAGLQDEEVPVSSMRKAIAGRLSESKFSAPHYYLKVDVNTSELIVTREKLKLDSSKKISFNSFLIKLAAEAIKHHPVVNSSWAESKIVRHGSVDVGLAVAVKDGLITPVVRNCGSKGIMEIESELAGLIELAGNGGLKKEQYEGNTFTISNLGSYGIDEFTAIINPPASAILAVGRITDKPVIDAAGNITAGPMMSLTLSCDHRVIDGAAGAAFLSDLKRFIEEPISAFY
ncbi:Dihydrolipoyllysine-residue acetyltransferase component of pyruvate dehydrogenase complex [Limihaloglobus sulfuriphilus]|uniref:Dihydrolipoamide acetyltransferase component of pyruvate dehydrogenase complex n=1 Tax=Limihaloglobus sulfuriphilus TaxID=1851148 RepID=A0A1Q2MAS1_9BACT|nr:dihydrolipoamide acetyltransferase family protein [Limihaloglobus sulfuriphilus]AQQ69781.1 Dihydrolipoyllysine-residue acetyltransferase component of pyruvate dehydrogenase complex [Limihaloglobus sulfuriphilus]